MITKQPPPPVYRPPLSRGAGSDLPDPDPPILNLLLVVGFIEFLVTGDVEGSRRRCEVVAAAAGDEAIMIE